jgi:hypothetical protein
VDSAAPIDEASEAAKSGILRESILIRDEFFVGRRFFANAHHAVWFIEEDQLKIYQSDTREVVCVFTGEEIVLTSSEIEQQESDQEASDQEASDQEEQESDAPMVIQMPMVAEDTSEAETGNMDDRGEGEIRRAA